MDMWTVMCFICMAVSALKWVNHFSQSCYLPTACFNTCTQDTCKALSRSPPCITYVHGFPQSNLSFSFRSNLSLHHATTLLHPSCFQATLLPPQYYCRQCFSLSPLTVYLMQSKLLHSSQTSITASHNLVVCLSLTSHSPPLYVGVALNHCMTDYHFTLSSRTLF